MSEDHAKETGTGVPSTPIEREEVEALLRTPNPRTQTGRRDRTLLLVAVQTG